MSALLDYANWQRLQAQRAAKGPRVLVIDDSPAEQALVSLALASSGFRHLQAGSLEEATQRIEDAPYVIVLDVLLPDSRGIQDAVAFCQGPALGCSVILHTSFYLDEIVEGAEAAGLPLMHKNPHSYAGLLNRIQLSYDERRRAPGSQQPRA